MSVALSTTETEYAAATSCCSQLLWMTSTLKDFSLELDSVPLFYDNTSAISIAKNPMQHSRTKHIDIQYYFFRDHVEKGDVVLHFIDTDSQVTDILTKLLDSARFALLRSELGVLHPTGLF